MKIHELNEQTKEALERKDGLRKTKLIPIKFPSMCTSVQVYEALEKYVKGYLAKELMKDGRLRCECYSLDYVAYEKMIQGWPIDRFITTKIDIDTVTYTAEEVVWSLNTNEIFIQAAELFPGHQNDVVNAPDGYFVPRILGFIASDHVIINRITSLDFLYKKSPESTNPNSEVE